MRPLPPRTGIATYSIIKAVIVTAILGSVGLVITSGILRARETADRTSCKNNLKQIGLALHNYHDTYRSFPIGALHKRSYGWIARMVPYLECSSLYENMNFEAPEMPAQPGVEDLELFVLRCPSNDAPEQITGRMNNSEEMFGPYKHSSYRGVAGSSFDAMDGSITLVNAEFPIVSLKMITDGTANTILAGETYLPITWAPDGRPEAFVIWAGTNGMWENTLGTTGSPLNSGELDAFGSPHEGGTHFVFGDGSVKFLSDDIDPVIYRGLGTRAGEEPVSDWEEHP